MQEYDLSRRPPFRFTTRAGRGFELLKSIGKRNDLLVAPPNARGSSADHDVLKPVRPWDITLG
jgi:hypothetical protein